jgi:DNA-binding NarL/FixJ family response regulator
MLCYGKCAKPPEESFDTNIERILVISPSPLLREGLKLIIEESIPASVTMADDGVSAARLVVELAPSVIVVDRPDTKASDLDRLFQAQGFPSKVVIIGWDENKIAVYSRSEVETATLGNLITLLRGRNSK